MQTDHCTSEIGLTLNRHIGVQEGESRGQCVGPPLMEKALVHEGESRGQREGPL